MAYECPKCHAMMGHGAHGETDDGKDVFRCAVCETWYEAPKQEARMPEGKPAAPKK